MVAEVVALWWVVELRQLLTPLDSMSESASTVERVDLLAVDVVVVAVLHLGSWWWW